MKKRLKCDDIIILTKELFLKSDECVHIQLSNEFPDYIGVMHKQTLCVRWLVW